MAQFVFKNNGVRTIFLFILFLCSGLSANAGWNGCNGDTCLPGFGGGSPTPFDNQNFCSNTHGHIAGWSFRSRGQAFPLDSFAGLPNPNLFYYAVMTPNSTMFDIYQQDRFSGEISHISRLQWIAPSTLLRDDGAALTSEACR